jgi:putative ABC transport system ATP-binding protein
MEKNHAVLSVKHLIKTYKAGRDEIIALNNVSFELYLGEFLAIMGTSGSGKSTLLNILGALDEPNSGEILLNGIGVKNMFKEPEATKYRSENVGFIFQSYNLLKDLTVEDNISLPLILQGTNSEGKVAELLEYVGLTKWKKHLPIELSGGQQQRVAIGRALITSPPIVLADEPTGNLDFNTSTELLKMLTNTAKKLKQSIILVTHDPIVASYADRVLFFHDGKIVDVHKCSKNQKEEVEKIVMKFSKIMENSL